jgi:hypothetical protein
MGTIVREMKSGKKKDSYSSCALCNKKTRDKSTTEQVLCVKCMAFIVENLDINPDDDYPLFIDYAYEAKRRLRSGDEIKDIFRNKPQGFEKWLLKNHVKKGYGLILEDNHHP